MNKMLVIICILNLVSMILIGIFLNYLHRRNNWVGKKLLDLVDKGYFYRNHYEEGELCKMYYFYYKHFWIWDEHLLLLKFEQERKNNEKNISSN